MAQTNKNIIGQMFPEVLKSRLRGEIEIVYTMVAYKSKMMHDEDDTLHLSPMGQKSNGYPRRKNTVVMIPLCFLQTIGTCVKLSSMIIHTSAEITSRKSHI